MYKISQQPLTPPASPPKEYINSAIVSNVGMLSRSKSVGNAFDRVRRKNKRKVVPVVVETDDDDDGSSDNRYPKRIALLEEQLKNAQQSNEILEAEVEKWQKKFLTSTSSTDHYINQTNLQSTTIATLESEITTLTRRLQKQSKQMLEVEKQNSVLQESLAKLVEERQRWVERENVLALQVGGLNAKLVEERGTIDRLKKQIEEEITRRKVVEQRDEALVAMVRTLEDHLREQQSLKEAAEERLEFEIKLRQSENVDEKDAVNAQYEQMIEDLRAEVKSLTEENLLLQNPTLNNININTTASNPTSNTTPPTLKTKNTLLIYRDSPNSPSGRELTNPEMFPPRSSSAIDLLENEELSNCNDGNSLEIMMLRGRAEAARESELKRLREENLALVNQLVATLDSVSMIK
ncbi:hypothetical protein HDU76_004236 [Blyttiomyces sp. JEL0837]|nr:hypothetical protein HDU76_004236 [Blyttiomyces sp. JEL0837]